METTRGASTENSPRKRQRPLVVRFIWWAAVLMLGLALGLWVNAVLKERSVLVGEELARNVVALNREASRLAQEGMREEAAARLSEAVAAMERGGGFENTTVYVYTLTDLGSLLLGGGDGSTTETTPAPAVVDGALEALQKAWNSSEGMDPKLRVRIARLLAYGELARGRLDAAERWYVEAARLDPDDQAIAERLETVRAAIELDKR